MATGPLGDRGALARIVASSLDRGETPSQIEFRLLEIGVESGSEDYVQAFADAARSVRLSLAIGTGDEQGAQRVMAEMQRAGQGNVIITANVAIAGMDIPTPANAGELTGREIQTEVPLGASIEEIAAILDEIAEATVEEYAGTTLGEGASVSSIRVRTAIGR